MADRRGFEDDYEFTTGSLELSDTARVANKILGSIGKISLKDVSEELDLSPEEVLKRIQALKKEVKGIVGNPKKGYRLTDDQPLKKWLEPQL